MSYFNPMGRFSSVYKHIKYILNPSNHGEHLLFNLEFQGMVHVGKLAIVAFAVLLSFVVLASSGCTSTQAKQPAAQPLPVKTETINLSPVPKVDEYVATVKSRRSASIQPQVDGSLTRIRVKSGDQVRTGQVLMTIDPLKQQATVDQQR